MQAWLAVGIGAALGAWMRWGITLLLHRATAPMVWGTLAANCLGGLMMGMLLALLQSRQDIPEPLRLLLSTGLLGGLTTFSAFSAESFGFLMRQQYAWLALHSALHVIGALCMTALGFYFFNWVKH